VNSTSQRYIYYVDFRAKQLVNKLLIHNTGLKTLGECFFEAGRRYPFNATLCNTYDSSLSSHTIVENMDGHWITKDGLVFKGTYPLWRLNEIW